MARSKPAPDRRFPFRRLPNGRLPNGRLTYGAVLAGALALAIVAVAVVAVVGGNTVPPAPAPQAGDAAIRVDLKPGPAGAVLTARGDLTRLGLDNAEPSLTPAALSTGRFGRRASFRVDGKVYAQPLFLPDLRFGGRSRDVMLVATEHDSVYAFDAHAATATPPLWRTSLLTRGARTFQAATDRIGPAVGPARHCDSIVPEVGITSTPVVDWAARTLFVVALDVENGVLTYRLHALDVNSGREKQPGVMLSAVVRGDGMDAVGGVVSFAAAQEQQRLALTEVGGTVYAGFGSWCEAPPFHGWVLGYSAATLRRTVVYNDSPDGWGGGLWESQAGIMADPHGHLFLVTGNGTFDLDRGGRDAGDTLLETVPRGGTLQVVDYFTPFNQRCLDRHDLDLGAGSPLTVPGAREFILAGKAGAVYVLSQASLGGHRTVAAPCTAEARTDVDQVRQELPPGTVPGGMWGTWAYWSQGPSRYVYASGADGRLTQWRLHQDGTISPVPVAQAPVVFGYPGAIPVTTGNASRPASGVVWTVDQTHGAALRAFAADDVGRQLWSSDRDAARDAMLPGEFDHFSVPVTADGLVIVADQSRLDIYGMLQG